MDLKGKRPGSVRTRCHVGGWFCLFVVLVAFGVALYRFAKNQSSQGPVRRVIPNSLGTTSIDVLRSLPYVSSVEADESEPSGVVFRDPERSCPGYNIYSVRALSMAELIDDRGKVVNFWSYSPSQFWSNCELLPNGDLLVVGAGTCTGNDGQRLQGVTDDSHYALRFNWQGQLLWKRELRSHHDIELTPDGKLQVLTFQRRLIPQIHPEIEVRVDQLTRLDQDGTVIKSHSILDAVKRSSGVFALQEVKPSKPVELAGAPWIDLFHCNSIEAMRHKHLLGKHAIYDLENVLVCSRHQNIIAVINWEKNELIWAWGQGEVSGPHDATVLENGHILLFDNGLGRKYSRVIEIDPVTGKIVWEYKADPPTDFYTGSRGSAQRLPNGNTLMAESDKGRAIEVTPQGELVWEFICPHKTEKRRRAAMVRIKRYPVEYIRAIINKHKK